MGLDSKYLQITSVTPPIRKGTLPRHTGDVTAHAHVHTCRLYRHSIHSRKQFTNMRGLSIIHVPIHIHHKKMLEIKFLFHHRQIPDLYYIKSLKQLN